MKDGYNVAIAGATGAVGADMIETLEKRNFPVKELRLLASARSAGKKLVFKGEDIEVQELTKDSFEGIDIALFSAGGSISEEFAPSAVEAGAVVVDNSSAFRMDEDVPLVVPEVNPEAVKDHKGIIANPNCSTIIMVVVANPLHKQKRSSAWLLRHIRLQVVPEHRGWLSLNFRLSSFSMAKVLSHQRLLTRSGSTLFRTSMCSRKTDILKKR